MTPLADALMAAMEEVVARGPVPVALSGGLDSWVLALLLRRMGAEVRGYSLVSGVPGYCEWEQTRQLASVLALPVAPLELEAGAFEEALPRFLAVTRTPIYNLHPVSKLLLAEELARRGERFVVTGDAADQVFRCEAACDLLPLTQACFWHVGVTLLTPFLTEGVRSLCLVPDPDKRPLRELAELLGIPPIAKRPTMYPGGNILRETTERIEAMACAESRA